jgi:hypothetical protein
MRTFNGLDQVVSSLQRRRFRDLVVASLFALGLVVGAAAVESTARTAMGRPSAADWAMGPARPAATVATTPVVATPAPAASAPLAAVEAPAPPQN